ncbi:MAG: S41 family peptidase [Gemmatimonadaceae bacterium]|nr:S41 family peptidase [Gemmatimonadaceae bacterium]NUO94410.1 S41 family peptidase [Gemmatimonadaceae bacterium]NUP55076.1 S41 family peptidase [Gemmatimonadaceae bacterium]NUP69689.1 S41 family peptidase [Gemmatimonadaceae bacterium]NUR34567.1 S41 family peptidase [Gemmatimonadaceae bacterium]
MLRPRTAAVASLLLIPMVAGGFFLQQAPPRATPRLFDQVLAIVASRYVDSLQSPEVFEKAAKGLVRELNDPYSELFAPRQSEEFNRSTGGRYGGVGMLLEEQKVGAGTSIIVSRIFPHTPAEDGGVHEGDRIMRVDSLPTADAKIDKVSDALRGIPGTSVQVVFQRPRVVEPVKLTFKRAVVHVPAVPYATIIGDRIGYIPLQTFNENTAEEVDAAATKLVGQGARGLVLDLRDNGGGIVEQALAVSSLFLKSGQPIVNVRSRNAPDEVARATSEHLATQPPLVILTDGGTASASEIVAGALQDHDRALVLGTTSFGKGLVQSLFPLDGGYALKITTGKWYTPSGRSIHRERKLLADGRFVETRPDSLETEAEKKARPTYSSDAGRTVYGGGGITPDVIVPDDTLLTTEQEFLRAIAPKAQAFVTVLNQYAFELKGSAPRDFSITPAWRTELRRRLGTAGITIDQKYEPAATRILDRELDRRLSRLVLGDAGARQRSVAEDHQLARAVALLAGARTQEALFAAGRTGASLNAAVKPDHN